MMNKIQSLICTAGTWLECAINARGLACCMGGGRGGQRMEKINCALSGRRKAASGRNRKRVGSPESIKQRMLQLSA